MRPSGHVTCKGVGCGILCQLSGAELEGHSIEIPVGSVVPSELIVMICHTLRQSR